MAGIVQAQTPATLTPQSVAAHMHLNPQQAQQMQRIVIAGMKVMFSPQSHQLVLKSLGGPAPMAQKLGQAIAGLMGLLMKESQNSLPGNLLVPAGMVLLAHAADFLNKSGQPISDQDIGAAMQTFVRAVMGAVGLDPQKVVASAQARQQAPVAPAQPTPGA